MINPLTSERHVCLDVHNLLPHGRPTRPPAPSPPPPGVAYWHSSGSFRFVCPVCRRYLRTESCFSGRQAVCPGCRTAFTIPPSPRMQRGT